MKEIMIRKFKLTETEVKEHFADTRDTLCYATNDNQTAVMGMLDIEADFAIVVGGYNSSNTSHLVELCEEKLQTFYISDADKIISDHTILHYDFHTNMELITENYLPKAIRNYFNNQRRFLPRCSGRGSDKKIVAVFSRQSNV